MRRTSTPLGVALAIACAAALHARPASACGGTYCDGQSPLPIPVDQTGENILFVMNGGFTEAHVQIAYDGGDAHRFAWIIPMPVVPTISVGSQPLFTNLLNATDPTYQLQGSFDSCGGPMCACGGSDAGSSGGDSGSGGGTGPKVVSREAVGAFDVTVLEGGTAGEVSQWLSDNGYATTSTTPSLLGDYVKQSYVFVAVKLQAGAGIDQIHPIVLRYASTMPCVPIRLTSVAAVDNMSIRAFFLGANRVYPENFALVDLNEAALDWVTVKNYDAVVSRAIDEAPDHHGFVVEYASNSLVVPQSDLFSARWMAAYFVTTPPERTVDVLASVGLAQCSPLPCKFEHPLVLPLLREYLPAPAGIDELVWYATLDQRAGEIDMSQWDGAAFQADYQERIVDPGRHAVEVLTQNAFLTRLLTRLSPSEMTEDPTFVERADLDEPDVDVMRTASQHTDCDGNQDVQLRGGEAFALSSTGSWPNFERMPFARRIRTVPEQGPLVPIVDNTLPILESIDAWNERVGFTPPGAGCAASARSTRTQAPLLLAAAALALIARRRRASGRRRPAPVLDKDGRR